MPLPVYRIESVVKDVLNGFPETRDNDMELIIQVWASQGLKWEAYQLNYLRAYCMDPKSIVKEREKINESS